MQRHMRQARLAVPNVADHDVEAGGQAADLIGGGDLDFGVLAVLQPLHGLVQQR